MMPICHYKKCTKPAEHNIGDILTNDEGDCWKEAFYLCEKHTKKIEKLLLTEIWRSKE